LISKDSPVASNKVKKFISFPLLEAYLLGKPKPADPEPKTQNLNKVPDISDKKV
jgi:hypothetical protein